jgi:DNA-binding HxlR family transcriptional regulator
MKTMLLHGSVEFRQLRYAIPRITDGNLASHLRVLEKSKYIHCYKEIIDRKLRTSYEITKKGRMAFEQLQNWLRKMVEAEDGAN